MVAVVVLALGLSALLSFVVLTPKYESKSQIFLSVDLRDASDSYAASLFLESRAKSYADLATSTTLAERVIDILDLDISPERFSTMISADVVAESTLIQITVTTESARQAQTINDVATNELKNYIGELESGDSTEGSQIAVAVTNEASFDPVQVSPRIVLNFVVGGLTGFLLGAALAVARDLLDRTIRTSEHVADITDAPVLARVGFDSDMRNAPLLTDLRGFAPRTEAFRVMRTNLQFIDLDHHPRCLVITSPAPGEGKTMTATNLAVAVAQTGRSTLIIDGDLRRPRVASMLGLDPAIGMTTALVGKTEVQDAIQVHEPSGLHVLTSGAKPPNPTEILQSRVTGDLIRRLRNSYDMVIIDAPPVLPVADASVLSTLADGVIVVVRHAYTTRDQLSDAVFRLQQVGGKLYGVVVNMVGKRALGNYYYYYEETAPVRGSRNAASSTPRHATDADHATPT